MLLRGSMVLAIVLFTACGAGEPGSVAPATTEVIGAPSGVLAVLPDGRLMVEEGGRLLGFDPRRVDLGPTVLGASDGVGEVRAAVSMDGATLVLASGGTFVLRGSSWLPSPLGEALDGPIRAAAQLPDGELWIATDRSLVRVAADQAEALALEGSLEGVELAVVQRPEGPALWVRLADRVLEIWRDRTGVMRTAGLVLPSAPEAIAGDASGTGWLVLEGRLYSIGLDRALVDRGLEASLLIGSAESDELWILRPEGAPILYANGAFLEASGVEIGAGDRVAIGPDGSLYVAGDTVQRFAPRHDVVVAGVDDGALVVTPGEVTIEAPGAPSIEATIDGAAVEGAQSIAIDPDALGDGQHELVIGVRYDDGTLDVEARRRFEVLTHATWSGDVEPIYAAHCAGCHGPAGPATTRLDTREAWMMLSEFILRNVKEQRMPLNQPPLNQREIALIEVWIESEFAE